MRTGYALEWLDTLISVGLDPDKEVLTAFSPGETDKLSTYIIKEKNKLLSTIKFTVFNLNDDDAISCAIKNYHSSLVSLLDQALDIKELYSEDLPSRKISDSIIASVEEVLFLIEDRFTRYLGVEERVPSTHFNAVRKKLLKNISRTVGRLQRHLYLFPTLDIIVNELHQLLNQSDNKNAHTFREMYYAKELCEEVELLQFQMEIAPYTGLDKVLIHMNFNSKLYIYDLTHRIDGHINSVTSYAGQMGLLLLDFKLFNQLHVKPGRILFPQEASLAKQMDNWFSQEIFYREKRSNYPEELPKEKERKKALEDKDAQKLRSILSVDQMALILRAADDLRIVTAKSLNSVFKNIVPYLSTPYRENISYDSMRSKSYAAETREKKIAIDTLRQMIQKINEY